MRLVTAKVSEMSAQMASMSDRQKRTEENVQQIIYIPNEGKFFNYSYSLVSYQIFKVYQPVEFEKV